MRTCEKIGLGEEITSPVVQGPEKFAPQNRRDRDSLQGHGLLFRKETLATGRQVPKVHKDFRQGSPEVKPTVGHGANTPHFGQRIFLVPAQP
jgi:hypothetical protein